MSETTGWEALQGLLGGLPVADFLATHYGKRWLHLPEADQSARFEHLIDWQGLEAVLQLNGCWDERKLRLIVDGRPLAAERYCMPAGGQDTGARVWRPVPERVMEAVGAGATLVLNGLDGLVPAINQLAGDLESSLRVRVQSNLYLSQGGHRGLALHSDPHDVLALQIVGSKDWQVHRDRIRLTSARGASERDLRHVAGPVSAQLSMQAGDLLYLPAGFIHQARAESEWSIHLTLGLKQLTRLDLLSMWVQGVADQQAFAEPLYDLHQGRSAIDHHLASMLESLRERAGEVATADQMLGEIAATRRPRGRYALPPKQTGAVRASGDRGRSE